ncbi:hypothetical protein [Variovorax sp. OV329]|uniref:hypothetical protein n=1 Tax=Variovorax sp. OV329 TaxID=1882825 RepID=UPI0008E12A96|nr:hypothetical protein [Variovorax sp. OV329]SFM14385.1 hypothetical protein SAMN05444747_1031 [Variovorax sp. OV329]
MSTIGPEGRSFKSIAPEDLARLLKIARDDIADYFRRYPAKWGNFYRDRLLGIALCQGAADHYCGKRNGIQDFDVYAFFAEHPEQTWYAKRKVVRDFGDAKFGQSQSRPAFVGRRVDLLSRGLPAQPGDDFEHVLCSWLSSGATDSAKLLAQKSAVILAPEERLGFIIWPRPAE